MDREQLRALQKPFKDRYRNDPDSARITIEATGRLLPDRIACGLPGIPHPVIAGLHPAAGGDGSFACAAELLLQALVGCAGTTLCAVATAMNVPLSGEVTARGTLDMRGTLGVDRTVPVGFTEIDLLYRLDTSADDATVQRMLEATERYCVVLQTLARPPEIRTAFERPRA
ncbi:MAG: OsmC family peroxiredoxin [Planctomycetota bacterium]|nr:MAG: OsmC family peroxiredoxin [Planctomycetota bacterium]